jgi:uncharacterized membrane protein YheB (UPF0754 family)
MNYIGLLLPLTGALLGWAFTQLGITLLFRSLRKNKPAIDNELSRMIAAEMVSLDEIGEKLGSPESFQKILPTIEHHIDHFLQHKLSKSLPFISMFIGDKTIKQLKAVFLEELSEIFPEVMKKYIRDLPQEIDLQRVIRSKLSAITPDRLEAGLQTQFGRQLRAIRAMGAAAGLLIGIIHLVISWLLM